MKKSEKVPSVQDAPAPRVPLRPWLVAGTVIVLLCLMAGLVSLLRQPTGDFAVPSGGGDAATSSDTLSSNPARRFGTAFPARAVGTNAASPEEIVAAKVGRFAANRRNVLHAYAAELKVPVPPDYERFFDLAEAGNWEAMRALFLHLKEQRQHGEVGSAEEAQLWSALFETYGVAEVAHDWPAQQLLDYGRSVLGALRPGMIYLGGTDAGRFIPTLLNETDGGERHIVLTQNALADGTYLQYAAFLYRDQFNALTLKDSELAFSGYIADATRRFHHDQDFPAEPKQLRPGEDVRLVDNRIQVGGQVAVMAINERLVQALMEKNPGASFAMEESFPFNSTYAQAAPLGPLLELRAGEAAAAMTPERAVQSVDYWRHTTQQLLAENFGALTAATRTAYSKMLSAQAGLLASSHREAEAEQIFRMATELTPANAEAVFRYVNLLVQQQRVGDAIAVTQHALATGAAKDATFQNLMSELLRMKTQQAN